MTRFAISPLITTIIIVLQWPIMVSADTWQLEQENNWKTVSAANEDRYVLVVARTEKLVSTGQKEALAEEWDQLRQKFPEIEKSDLDTFIKAEMFFCEGKYMKAARRYDIFLDKDYRDNPLYQLALERQFHIADGLLNGQKVTMLWLFKVSAYGQGVKMMDKITERAGERPIGLQAGLKAADYYEKNGKFGEAYLKWSEIYWQWPTGQTARDALLAMARCKHATYKGPRFDASCLESAKTYYTEFKTRYHDEAKELGIDEKIEQIDEQIAYKQFRIGQYYQRTGKTQAANLYYDMVVRNWSHTKAAESAKEMLNMNSGNGQDK